MYAHKARQKHYYDTREHRGARRAPLCAALSACRETKFRIKAVARALYVSSDGIFAGIFYAEFSRNFPEFSRYAVTCCSDDVARRGHILRVNISD